MWILVVKLKKLTFPILTSSECSKVVANCSQVGAMALQWPHHGAKNFTKWAPETRKKEKIRRTSTCSTLSSKQKNHFQHRQRATIQLVQSTQAPFISVWKSPNLGWQETIVTVGVGWWALRNVAQDQVLRSLLSQSKQQGFFFSNSDSVKLKVGVNWKSIHKSFSVASRMQLHQYKRQRQTLILQITTVLAVINSTCSPASLPLDMWALKVAAVSSYMPCLGSGAFGGSCSLSGSWRAQKKMSVLTPLSLHSHF